MPRLLKRALPVGVAVVAVRDDFFFCDDDGVQFSVDFLFPEI